MKTLQILALFFALQACGDSDKVEAESSPQATAAPEVTASTASLKGFVANAFEVTVDGQAYPDLESFYTAELIRLPEKAKAAGYPDVESVKFEAQIGFQDLFHGMEVYALSAGATGYQGTSRVGPDGSFSMSFPEHSASYKIRANKRIRIVLQRPSTTLNICYNFSAIEKSASLNGEPMILSDFSSSLTAYDCPVTSTSKQLEIPVNTEITPAKLVPGMTKAQVLDSLGSKGLYIEQTRWCWREVSVVTKHKNCEMVSGYTCQCSVSFDADGKLNRQDNIAVSLLDILSW